MLLERPSSQSFRGRRSSPFIIAPDDDDAGHGSSPDDETDWHLVHQEIDSLEDEFQAKKQALQDELSALAKLAESTPNTASADSQIDRRIDDSQQEVKSISPAIASSIEQRERRQKLQTELESSTRELLAGISQLQQLGTTTMSLLGQLKSLDATTLDVV